MTVSSGLRLACPRVLFLALVARPVEGGATARRPPSEPAAAASFRGECLQEIAEETATGCQSEDGLQAVSFRQRAIGFQQSVGTPWRLASSSQHAAAREGTILPGAAGHNASGLRGGTEDSQEEVFILHIGKTGGTSIVSVLAPALAPEVTRLGHEYAREELHACADNPSHKYVYVVRAPLQRYVSGWISRFRMGGSSHFNPWFPGELKAFLRFRSPDELGCALNSSSPQRRAAALEAMNSIQHVKWSLTNYWGGLDNFDKCVGSHLFVARQEHLQEDYELLVPTLASRNLLAQDPDLTISKEHSTPAEYDGFRHLSERARANLQQWYHEDYDLLERLAARGLLPETYPAEARTSDGVVEPVFPVNWLLFRTTWFLAAFAFVAVAGLAALGLLATSVTKGREGWVWSVFLGLFWVSALLSVPCGVMIVILWYQ